MVPYEIGCEPPASAARQSWQITRQRNAARDPSTSLADSASLRMTGSRSQLANAQEGAGAKNRIVRASILSRGAAFGGEPGSSNAEWAVKRVRCSSESKHLSSN